MKKDEIVIITPAISDDDVSQGLYNLSKKLGKLNPKEQHHGLLGGEWGYGQDFENDIFMMHSYCWCEQDTCKWCNGIEPNFKHKKSGFEASWYKYIGRSMEYNPIVIVQWKKILKECMNSIGGKHGTRRVRRQPRA